jgi:hypothetical protein
MTRTFWLATAAAFGASVVLAFVFHGVILAPDYTLLPGVYRGPQFRPGLFALLLLGQLIMAAAMVAIYRYGRENRPWPAQGLRFGLLVALASVVPCYLIGYAVTNIPAALAAKQIVLEAIRTLAMGLAVAWIHR